MKKCPECDSEKIIEAAKVIDYGKQMADYGFKVAVDGDPNALIFKERVYSDVEAKICADCGYIRFFAISPRKLWTAYQNRQKDIP